MTPTLTTTPTPTPSLVKTSLYRVAGCFAVKPPSSLSESCNGLPLTGTSDNLNDAQTIISLSEN